MKQIIIDTPNICWASHYKLKSLRVTTEEGSQYTGAIFGLLRTVIALAQQFKSNAFYFCFEGGHNKRKKLYPEYKGNRDKDNEDIGIVIDQLNLLNDRILENLGFSMVCSQTGYEADDIIAQLCNQMFQWGEDIIVVSGDQDLYQLLTPNVSQYLPKKNKLYTYEDFKREYGLEPYEWAQYKAIAGDSSDNIPGIRGMGPVKTLSLLKRNGWEEDLSEEDWATYNQFMELTKLPFPKTPYQELWQDELSFEKFVAVCEEYKFDSLLIHDSDNWQRIVEGDFTTAKERVSASLKQGRRRRLFDGRFIF